MGVVARMKEIYTVIQSKPGYVLLADGSKLVLRVVIVGVKYAGFSPFGGVNFAVKTAGGVSSIYIPDDLKGKVKDKPLSPPDRVPEDGWELVEIKNQEPSMEEVEVEIDEKKYRIKVVGEVSMVSRNLNYKTSFDEPVYWVHWGVKVQWRQVER